MSEWKLEDHCDDPVRFPGIITFDGWCAQRAIEGNWKDALYRHILATRDGSEVNDANEWEKAWNEVLDRDLARYTHDNKEQS